MKKYFSLIILFLVAFSYSAKSQQLDKVVAVVGNSIILKSEIENQYIAQGSPTDVSAKCLILHQLLTQKLLAQQAAIDSISVTEDEVDDNINNRLRYMSNQAGGQEKLEEFLNRSLLQYKEEMRPTIREMLIANKMQRSITEDVDVTPNEVKRYFENIPADSLPNFNTEVEIGEIVFQPKLTEAEKKPFYDRAEQLRQEIIGGKDFATMARLYSQDPGSAPDGGEMPFADRDSYVKEFSAVAFKLKAGEISKVFETDFGYHFLQVLERRGEQVRVRHILFSIVPTEASLTRAKELADSVYTEINAKRLDFYNAATIYSDDKETKYNGGMILNAQNVQTRTTYIPVDQLDAGIFTAIDTLQPGEYSRPSRFTGPDGKSAYRLVYLKSRTPPHQASFNDDFAKIKQAALEEKMNKVVSEWFDKRKKSTYIRIDQEYQDCDVLKVWL